MNPQETRDRRTLARAAGRCAAGVLAVAAAGLLSACTSSSGSPGNDSTPTGQASTPSTSATAPQPSSSAAGSSGTSAVAPPAKTDSGSGTASSSGTVNDIVPSRTIVTKSPIPLTGVGSFSTQVTARIVTAQRVTTQAHGPGEISGPGVKLTIRLSNGTARSISLDQVVVNVSDQNGDPASPILSDSASAFHGAVNAHAMVNGVYVFTLPTKSTTKVNVEMSYSANAPTIVFSGSLT